VQGDVLHYDLTKGRYSCTVEVGKSYATKREEGVAALSEFAKVQPELVPKYADIWVKGMDFPEAEAVAQRLAPPSETIPGLPPQAQALVQGLQQQVQQLQQAIATKQPELQTKQQIAAMQAQKDLQIAQANNQTALTKAEISASATMSVAQAKVDAENFRSYVDSLEQRIAKDADLRLKIAHTLAQHHADAAQATAQRTHDTMAMALEHAHDHAMADKTAQHAQDLAQTQAALQPAPEPAANA
jgi:hypothetical protein